MRKTILVLTSVAVAMLVAGGVAWAANIQCRADTTCLGTKRADRMLGTSKKDDMFGKEGNDAIYGRGAHDFLWGQLGSDKLYGGAGPDLVLGQVGSDSLYGGPGSDTMYGSHWNSGDTSDDYVHGGADGDTLYGGPALSGVDHLYGDDGIDYIHVSQRQTQRLNGKPIPPVSKEIVDCGPGADDTVLFDEGIDVVMDNCENKKPYLENSW